MRGLAESGVENSSVVGGVTPRRSAYASIHSRAFTSGPYRSGSVSPPVKLGLNTGY